MKAKFTINLYTLIVVLIFFCIVPLFAQVEDKFRIFNTESNREIDLESLTFFLADANIVFFGEVHNDSISHLVLLNLYESMLLNFGDVSLSMEMFERDVQLVMDEFLAGLISEEKLIQEGKAWSNYNDYAPIVALAKDASQTVVAANVPGRYAQMVSRKGLASLQELDNRAQGLFETFDLPSNDDPYRKKFFEAMGGHGHRVGPEIFHAQLLRDATMASSIFGAWRKNRRSKVLHITGRFHSDGRMGTVKFLQDKRRRLKIMVISCFPAEDFENPGWEAYKELGDFVIITDPAIKRTY